MKLDAKIREHIEPIILEKLKTDFNNVEIIEIAISMIEQDEEGALVDVKVAFSGRPKDIDPKKISSSVRNIRPDFEDTFGENAFPVLSFIAKSELGNRKLETL